MRGKGTPSAAPTVVSGGDVDTFTGWFPAAERRHAVERLDGKNVGGLGQQAPHLHPALHQAVLGRPVTDAVSTGQADRAGRPAHAAPDGITQVRPAAALQRLVPLQAQRAVVHLSDDAAWSRGRFCSDTGKGKSPPRLAIVPVEQRSQRAVAAPLLSARLCSRSATAAVSQDLSGAVTFV